MGLDGGGWVDEWDEWAALCMESWELEGCVCLWDKTGNKKVDSRPRFTLSLFSDMLLMNLISGRLFRIIAKDVTFKIYKQHFNVANHIIYRGQLVYFKLCSYFKMKPFVIVNEPSKFCRANRKKRSFQSN